MWKADNAGYVCTTDEETPAELKRLADALAGSSVVMQCCFMPMGLPIHEQQVLMVDLRGASRAYVLPRKLFPNAMRKGHVVHFA